MRDSRRMFDHKINKFSGVFKEAAGKVTGNEQLELKGKIQSTKADVKINTNVKDKIEGVKDGVAEKINNRIDRNRKNKK